MGVDHQRKIIFSVDICQNKFWHLYTGCSHEDEPPETIKIIKFYFLFFSYTTHGDMGDGGIYSYVYDLIKNLKKPFYFISHT